MKLFFIFLFSYITNGYSQKTISYKGYTLRPIHKPFKIGHSDSVVFNDNRDSVFVYHNTTPTIYYFSLYDREVDLYSYDTITLLSPLFVDTTVKPKRKLIR